MMEASTLFKQRSQDVLQQVLDTAAGEEIYVIARAQDKRDTSILLINGKTEHMGVSRMQGLGVQAFTPDGHSGFAASDDFSAAAELTQTATRLARLAEAENLERNREVFEVAPLQSEEPLRESTALSLNDQRSVLTQLNEQVRSLDPRLSVKTSCSEVKDSWRIVRSDLTNCFMQISRSRVIHEITAKEDGQTASTSAGIVGVDAAVLQDSDALRQLHARARRMANLAIGLLNAPTLSAGNYKLILDYALAKGLAHEAFGHAAESDAMETSILGRDGKFRAGERVAPDFVSILDGPLEDDFAYQPISANGEKRKTVAIVKDGILNEALADTFSAREAGVEPTGAARVENYACLPLPRMTNTRILVRNPIPLEVDFEDVTPEILKQVLVENGLMKPDEKALYLTGYRGGQVNTTLGDFVFNCAAIYDLSDLTLYQPAIFSGKVLSVLSAIRAGIGELLTNAPGICGKRGQSVPSSGGCHAFLVVDAHPDVMVGGRHT